MRLPAWLRRRPLPTQDAEAELADVLAVLKRRRTNCEAVIRANKPEAERASIIRQELNVLIGEFAAGLHRGEAAVRAAILAGEQP